MERGLILQLCYMHLGGMHMSAWRDPGAPENPGMNFAAIKDAVIKAEQAKMHAIFWADSLALYERSAESRARMSINAGLEHFTMCAALSVLTNNIGMVVTGNTTYNEPYHLARKYASLDHLSGGRIGWNAVTSGNPLEAANFGRTNADISHDDRYARAGEFIDVAQRLWDSWDEDAFVRDRKTGLYSKVDGFRALNHAGPYFRVAGPLTSPRLPQGYPILYQAGASEIGKRFASKYGEVVISMQSDINAARKFREELRTGVVSFGRNPDDIKIVTNFSAVLGRTQDQADERMALLDSLVDPIPGVEQLSTLLLHDLTNAPLDQPVPTIPETSIASRGVQSFFLGMIRRDNLTVRKAAQLAARAGGVAYSAKAYADRIEEWYTTGASDGINLAFADLGQSLDVMVEEVIPDLQRRGLFRKEYQGRTLRENLGLSRPPGH